MTREQAFERIAELEAEVEYLRAEIDARCTPADVVRIQSRMRLSPAEATIVAELLRVYPRSLPAWALTEKLPAYSRKEGSQDGIKVQVSHIRHKCGRFSIVTLHSHGYAIGDEWVAALREAIAA